MEEEAEKKKQADEAAAKAAKAEAEKKSDWSAAICWLLLLACNLLLESSCMWMLRSGVV